MTPIETETPSDISKHPAFQHVKTTIAGRLPPLDVHIRRRAKDEPCYTHGPVGIGNLPSPSFRSWCQDPKAFLSIRLGRRSQQFQARMRGRLILTTHSLTVLGRAAFSTLLSPASSNTAITKLNTEPHQTADDALHNFHLVKLLDMQQATECEGVMPDATTDEESRSSVNSFE